MGEALIDKKSSDIVKGFSWTNCAGRSCIVKRSTCKCHCSLLHHKQADQILSSCKLVKLHWFCGAHAWVMALYYNPRKSGAIALLPSGGQNLDWFKARFPSGWFVYATETKLPYAGTEICAFCWLLTHFMAFPQVKTLPTLSPWASPYSEDLDPSWLPGSKEWVQSAQQS